MSDAKAKTLRPAVEWVLARSRKRSGDDLPTAVRKVMRFKRLPAPAVAQVMRAVDDDAEFRTVISSGVKESEVGRGGFLWLTRPTGWETEFESILGAEQRHAEALREIQLEREGIKSVDSLRQSLSAAQLRIAALEDDAESLSRELESEREHRQRLEADLTAAEGRAADFASQRVEAVRQMKKVEEVLLRRNREREELLARIVAADSLSNDARAADMAGVASALAKAEGSLLGLADALVPLRATLDPIEKTIGVLQTELELLQAEIETASTDGSEPGDDKTEAGVEPVARLPIELPPGIRDDSLEAAEFLVGVSGSMLLVDGYNASMNKWPNDTIENQRRRLVAGLDTLAARTSIDIDVIFDGADEGGSGHGSRYLGVRVRFSPVDVEADDVIIDTAAALPSGQAVLVVSDDERVRSGVRRSGANVLTVHQLFGLIR